MCFGSNRINYTQSHIQLLLVILNILVTVVIKANKIGIIITGVTQHKICLTVKICRRVYNEQVMQFFSIAQVVNGKPPKFYKFRGCVGVGAPPKPVAGEFMKRAK